MPASPRSSLACIDAMIGAVNEEIAATRGPRRRRDTRITDGKRIAIRTGWFLYRFPLRRRLSLSDGIAADCSVSGRDVPGTVVSLDDEQLVLAFQEDLGKHVPHLDLHVDASWLLDALRQRLEELRPRIERGEIPAVDRLLGRSAPRTGDERVPAHVRQGAMPLLAEQRDAVARAVGSDTLFLWGPAGTGKSTTLSALMEALLPTDSVLLVAHTNAAVDGALLKVVDRLYRRGPLPRERVVRIGPIVDDELAVRFGADVAHEKVAAKRQNRLSARLERVERERDNLTSSLSDLIAMLRFRTALPDEIEDWAAMGAQAELLERRIAQLDARADVLRRGIATVGPDVLRRARIVACTAQRTCMRGQIGRDFDTVIVDEAAAITPPLAVSAAALAHRRVVLAGDFRQLPAPVRARTPLARRWLGRDPFTIARIPQLVAAGRGASHVVMLRTQFRMAPDIAWLVNDPIYGGLLRDHPSVAARGQGPLGPSPLILVDTSKLCPRALRLTTGSRLNASHAFVVGRVIEALENSRAGHTATVGIIAPFRAQVDLVRSQMQPAMSRRGIEAATVHCFQGGERDIIVADLCDSTGLALSGFLSARSPEEDSGRLLNVMFTRARQHVVLIANVPWLLENLPVDGLLRELLLRYLARCRRVGLARLFGRARRRRSPSGAPGRSASPKR